MNYFEENNKILSFKGVLGRRNYILIYLWLCLFACIIWQTPLFWASLFNFDILKVIVSVNPPVWFSVSLVIFGIIISGLLFPAIVRRLRDILGIQDDNKIFVVAAIILAINIISLTPIGKEYNLFLLDLIIDIFLICTKGKITGQKPKSELIKFNWGAFLGSWIWGIWNKTYKTFWIIPLFLTLGWPIFMLICGLKGNEWAFEKNKEKYPEVKIFHDKQVTQTIIMIFLAPIISLICLMTILAFSTKIFINYSSTHPELKNAIIEKSLQYQQKAVESTYTNIETNDNEYKFYLSPKDWNALNLKMKYVMFDNALYYVLIKEGQTNPPYLSYAQKIKYAPKIKILSNYNNEILENFLITPELEKKLNEYENNKDFQQAIYIWKNCIKINANPSLP